jgi:hypothetical protein
MRGAPLDDDLEVDRRWLAACPVRGNGRVSDEAALRAPFAWRLPGNVTLGIVAELVERARRGIETACTPGHRDSLIIGSEAAGL